MRKRTTVVLLGVLGFLVTNFVCATQSTLQDKNQILQSVQGSTALVVFWRADCPPCIDELRLIPKIAKAHPTVKIVLVSLNERTKADQHLTDQLPSTIANLTMSNASKELLAAFGNQQSILPYSVGLHKDGQICQTHVGILGTSLANKWEKIC